MNPLDILVVGVGDTFSDSLNTSALVLHCNGFRLAIDCPDRYRAALKQASANAKIDLGLDKIDEVFLTHIHGDHINGLEGVAFFKRFAEQRRTKLCCSPELRKDLWDERLKGSMKCLWNGKEFLDMSFDDYFDFRLANWNIPFEIGPFQIQVRRTIHHVPTSAMLIKADGKSLGYSADTAFDPGLIEFLSQADLIIHETNYGPAHTNYDLLAQLPAELRSKMRLIHYSDWFDADSSLITCLREGDWLSIS
jgi:ribonuclease BN (tRNA processing enzyme)